ncbi:MAG: PIN domain-containing protein [Anaerolineae bacterium]|nr:PIN domain-containing protein [Anaerolineae bacterium]
MRIYLDTSVYNRPFDDQTQPRIWLETLAFSVILQMIENNIATLVTSAVVDYENSRNPHQLRRAWVNRVAAFAADRQLVNEEIRQRADTLEQDGLKPLDALHIACAETVKADYFVTCDDRFINRYRRLQQGTELIVCNPTELVRIVGE